jgi:release factor glutamine methyltransferase
MKTRAKLDKKPVVSGTELQKRKLRVMAESVEYFKEVAGMKIKINPNVYTLGTDTYLLANTVKIEKGQDALDLCTGTGVIACKLVLLGAKLVLGVDLNPKAVKNAKENKNLLGLNNATFRLGNMFVNIDNKFDVITINPPYTDKPATNDIDICFYDGGHKALIDFFGGLQDHLKPGGIAYIAWSNITDEMDLLPRLAKEYGYNLALIARDVGGAGYEFYVYKLSNRNL